jgi:hypothetical protein
VGCHAHVLQGHEPWSGGYIFHGVGNFLFWPPCAPLEHPGPWPRYVREVGVVCCRLACGEVRDVEVRHLLQDGLALRWDETPRRKRLERRLCHSLHLADRSFVWTRRVEAFHARHVLFRLHSMRQAGGFWPWLTSRLRRLTSAARSDLRR